MNNSMANCFTFDGNEINVRMSNIDFETPVTAAATVATSFKEEKAEEDDDGVSKIMKQTAAAAGDYDGGGCDVEQNNGDNDAAAAVADDSYDNEDEKKLQLCRCCGKSNKELYPLYMMKCNSNKDAVAAAAVDNKNITRIADGSCNNTNNTETTATKTSPTITVATASTTATTTAAAANEAVELMLNAFAKNSHKMDIILEETHIWQLQIQRDDGLPQFICRQCTAQFYMVRKFRRKCLKVQARLRADYERMLQQQQQYMQQQQQQQHPEEKPKECETKTLKAELFVKQEDEEGEQYQCYQAPKSAQPIVETLSDILDEERILKAHVIYKQCSPQRQATLGAANEDVEMKEIALMPNAAFDVSHQSSQEYSEDDMGDKLNTCAGAVMTDYINATAKATTSKSTTTSTNEQQKTEENAPPATITENKIRLKICLTTTPMSSSFNTTTTTTTKRDIVKAIQRRHRRIQVIQRTVRTRSMASRECNKTEEHLQQHQQKQQQHCDTSNCISSNHNNIAAEIKNTSTCNQFAHDDDESVALLKNQLTEVIEHKPSKRARIEPMDEDQVKLPWKTKAARKEIPNSANAEQIKETIRGDDALRISTTMTAIATATTRTDICEETAEHNIPALESADRNDVRLTDGGCLAEVIALPSGSRHHQKERCLNKMSIFIKRLPIQIRNKAITKILQEKHNENMQLNCEENSNQQLNNAYDTALDEEEQTNKSVLQMIEKVFLPEVPASGVFSATTDTESNLVLTTTKEILTESTIAATADQQCKLNNAVNEQHAVVVRPQECIESQLELQQPPAPKRDEITSLNVIENRTKENCASYEDDELMVRIPLSSLTDAFKRRIADTVKSTDCCDNDAQVLVNSFELNKDNELNDDVHFLTSAVVVSSSAAATRDDMVESIEATTTAISDETLSISMDCNEKSIDSQSEFFGFNESLNETSGKETMKQEHSQHSACPDKINDLFEDLQLHCEAVTSDQRSVKNDEKIVIIKATDGTEINDDDNDETIVEPKSSTDSSMLDNNNDVEMNDVESTLNGILSEMQDQHIYTPVADFLTPTDYSPLTEQTLQEASPTTAASDDVSSVYVPSPAMLMTVSTECYDESQQQLQQQTLDDQQQRQTQTMINDAEPTATQTTLNEFFSNAFSNYEQVFPEDANVQANLIGFQNDIPCFENINTNANATNTLPLPHVQNVTSTNSALRGTRQLAELISSSTATEATTNNDLQNISITANQQQNAVAATSTIGIISSAVNQTEPIFISNQTVEATATTAARTTQATATVANTLQIELSELLDELQPTTTSTSMAHEQQQQHQPDQLLNSSYTYAQLQPISQSQSNDSSKLQFITLPQVDNIHEYHQQKQQEQQQHFAHQPLQHTQLQWSAAGGLESIHTTNEPITTASLPNGSTTTTTTYYINTADLYQPTLDNATLATLTTLQQQQNTQQQQQTQILELDKHHHTLVDGNENYLETSSASAANTAATMSNGQQIMIVIPHGSNATASTDVHNPVASASNPHQAPLQLYSNTELHTLDNTHHHHQQQQPHQQTVLLQTPPRSHKSTGGGSHVFLTSTPLTQQQQCVTPNALHYTLSPNISAVNQTTHSCSVAAAAAAAAAARKTPPTLLAQKGSSDRISLNCRFCHSRPRFTNDHEYSKHIIEMHPAPAPFNCPHCPMLFAGRAKRQQHIIEQHFSRRFPCGQCGQAFTSQRSLDLHLQRNHAPLIQPSNGGVGGTQQFLIQQQQQCVDVEDVQLQLTEEPYIDGVTDIDSSATKITCEVIRTPEAKKHTRILCCPDCDDSTSDEHYHGGSPAPMLTILHDQQEMTTTACPSPAAPPTPLGITNNSPISGAHITMPSPEQSEPDSTSTTTLRQFRRRRTSPIAPNPSGGYVVTNQAPQTSAPSPSSSPSSSTADTMQLGELRSTHNCLYCSAHFTNDIALRKHHQLAHREQTYMPFVCTICKRGFRMRPALQRHMESHNSEGRPFECDTCHVRFPRRSQLRLHIITVHMLTKPHTCEECGKQFGTESALNTHIKFHGERKFECSVCKYKFFLKKDLRKHWRIHTGEKFYKCDICTDSFLHYSRYSAHISGHMPPAGVFVQEDKAVRPNEELVVEPNVDEKLQLTDLNSTTGMKITVLKPNDINNTAASIELNNTIAIANNNNNIYITDK